MTIWRKPKVTPKCYDPKFQHFIGADGSYYPCCFLRVGDGRAEFKARIGKDFALLNTRKYTQPQILHSLAWLNLYRSFYTKPMDTCLRACPKVQPQLRDKYTFDGLHTSKLFTDLQARN